MENIVNTPRSNVYDCVCVSVCLLIKGLKSHPLALKGDELAG